MPDVAVAPPEVARGETVRAPIPTAPGPAAPMMPRSWVPTPSAPVPGADTVASPPASPEPAGGRRRSSTLRIGEAADVHRSDPPAVSGEMLVIPEPEGHVSSEGIAVALASSGPPLQLPGFEGSQTSTDPGSFVRSGLTEITGPQPRAQAEITGPLPTMPLGGVASSHSTVTLWVVAATLMLLAAGVLIFVLTR